MFCMVLLHPGDKALGARPGSVLIKNAAAAQHRIRCLPTRSRPATAGEKTETVNPQDAVQECWNAKRRDLPPAQYMSPAGRTPSRRGSSPHEGRLRKHPGRTEGKAQPSRSPLTLRSGRGYKAASCASS